MLASAIGTVRTIDDVLANMRAIDSMLRDDDGLKWFNFLYLKVTEAVSSDRAAWRDWEFLQQFDVRFAQLYFDAIVNWERNPSQTPHSWRPLLRARSDTALWRIQFALAGMNAHINHDIAIALEAMAASSGGYPPRDSARHSDFERVNGILERTESELRALLAVGLVGHVDRALGNLDSILLNWNVRKARDAGWTNGEVLWHLRAAPLLKREYLVRLDQTTSFAGHGLLVPRLGAHV